MVRYEFEVLGMMQNVRFFYSFGLFRESVAMKLFNL